MYFIGGLSLMEFVQLQGQTENLLNLFSYLGMPPPSIYTSLKTKKSPFISLVMIFLFGSSGKSVGKFRFGKFPHRQK
ncbi:MAG: hypothetical protein BA865_08895 [Desulfobacterales bacterium S5133MH4]|nr:MAG: hypothetical protein BA865_08895 [Desulfobacterales bacterium S5133MH4]